MQVQDACNIVAVMHTYMNAIRYLREKNGYEYKYADHPAIVMFHDKFEDMLRVPFSERTDRLSWAMDECKKIAEAP